MLSMRIFALDTDTAKQRRQFLYADEKEVLFIRYHGIIFVLALCKWGIVSAVLIALAGGALTIGLPWAWVSGVAAGLWLFFVFPPLLQALLDWRFDFTLVTTDKVVLFDQTSIFRQRVTPMSLENFATVSAETQWWNLFSFGILRFHAKEGLGQEITLKYIPHAEEVATKIAEAVTIFQRRKDLRRYAGGGMQAR